MRFQGWERRSLNVVLGVMALECSGGYQSDQIRFTMLVIALLSALDWFPPFLGVVKANYPIPKERE